MMDRIRLLCLAGAGKTALEFLKWGSVLDNNIEVCPVELAGRGICLKKLFYSDMNQLLVSIEQKVREESFGCDYILCGHSLGATIIYELMHRITDIPPKAVVVLGNCPPYYHDYRKYSQLSDNEIIRVLSSFEGEGDLKVLNENNRSFFWRIIRADMSIVENYRPITQQDKWPSDLLVFAGNEDYTYDSELNYRWSDHTEGICRIKFMSGGHFFYQEHVEEIVNEINSYCKKQIGEIKIV